MKKHFLLTLCSIAVMCGVAGCCTKSDPYFGATVKHVDMGGEMFSYQNLAASMRSVDNMLAHLEKSIRHPRAKSLVRVFAKSLDLKSIRAIAQSSVKVEPRLYVYKSFLLIDENSKSILSGKAERNQPLDAIMRSLPADTRLAIYTDVDSAFLWARLNEEIAASGDRKLIRIVNNAKANFKAKGVDIDALAESVSGPMMLVVTGQSPLGMQFAVIIADRDGVLSAKLRKKCAPKSGDSAYPVKDLPFFPRAQLVYADGCIMFVSDPKLLEKPAKMLGDTPRFRKFAPHLPKKGSGFMIVDISKNFAKSFNRFVPRNSKSQLKPFSMITVDSVSKDGAESVTVSNISMLTVSAKIMETTFPTALSMAKRKLKAIRRRVAPAPVRKPAAKTKKPAAKAKKPAAPAAKPAK